MKFSSLLISVLSSFSLVLTKPIEDQYQCDKNLCYWLSDLTGGTASVVGLSWDNPNAKIVNIPNQITIEGYSYRITDVGNEAFYGNSNLEEVTISSELEHLYLSHNAFADCENLKKVELNCQSVSSPDTTPFSNPNNDVTFLGRAVKSFVDDQAVKLVQLWGFTVKDYSKESEYTKKEDLFNLAKITMQYLRGLEIKDSGNAAVALKVKFATRDGYARLYRLLAIAMGIPENEIFVGTDGKNHYWNYFKVDGEWYDSDIWRYPFRMYSMNPNAKYFKPFFLNKYTFRDYLVEEYPNSEKTEPYEWLVVLNHYGYADECNGQPTTENFEYYLSQNNLGIHNDHN